MRTVLLLVPVLLSAPPERDAIRKGIAYLDGALFALPDASGTPRKPFTFAVAGLVHLMHGETRSPAPSPVARIRDYLVRWTKETVERLGDPRSLPPQHGLASSEYLVQYSWPFAMAGWFFAELELRRIATPDSRRALDAIVAELGRAQDPNGGWGHGRVATGATPSGYPSTLLASSNVVGITLGILDAMGRGVPEATLRRAKEYFRAARLDNGSFPYDPSQRQSGLAETNVGRTAGALAAWQLLGMPRDADFRGSAAYLLARLPLVREGHGSPALNVMHGAIACRLHSKEALERFRAEHVERILAKQSADGALECICEGKAFGVTCDSRSLFGGAAGGGFEATQRCYTTALHLFALLLPAGRLETLERRKPAPDAPSTARTR